MVKGQAITEEKRQVEALKHNACALQCNHDSAIIDTVDILLVLPLLLMPPKVQRKCREEVEAVEQACMQQNVESILRWKSALL